MKKTLKDLLALIAVYVAAAGAFTILISEDSATHNKKYHNQATH